MNGSHRQSSGESLEERVKRYYRHVEEYDWTRAADNFVGPETLFHRARRDEILKLVRRHAPSPRRTLDVGCGTALITRSLPGERISGVDLNPRNLQKARRYAPDARFILCDAEDALPFADESFDLVVCTEMLEHLINPERTVSEICRVLRSGGRLVGSVPGRSIIWSLRGLSNSKASFAEEPYHKHYRRAEVEALISAHLHIERLYSKHLRMNWFFVGGRHAGG